MALERGERWREAAELFRKMRASGTRPSALTYAPLIGVMDRCNKQDMVRCCFKQNMKPTCLYRAALVSKAPFGTSALNFVLAVVVVGFGFGLVGLGCCTDEETLVCTEQCWLMEHRWGRSKPLSVVVVSLVVFGCCWCIPGAVEQKRPWLIEHVRGHTAVLLYPRMWIDPGPSRTPRKKG